MSLKAKHGAVDTSKGGNDLLDRLPPRQRNGVLAQCERVDLDSGTILCEAGEPFQYAYFPITGNISVVNALVGHEPFETEGIGRDGMLGAALILDVNLASRSSIVLTRCLALRLTAKRMRAALKRHPAFLRILQRYLYFVLSELSQSRGCVHFHDVGKRLARGLLLVQDRARTDDLPLTHQLLADTLGVRRGAITLAAIKLQREGVIRYSRGRISILNRKKLEASSCSCYGTSIENYASIFS